MQSLQLQHWFMTLYKLPGILMILEIFQNLRLLTRMHFNFKLLRIIEEKMIQFGGILLTFISFCLIRAGIQFKDKQAAVYLTKIRLISAGVSIFIG